MTRKKVELPLKVQIEISIERSIMPWLEGCVDQKKYADKISKSVAPTTLSEKVVRNPVIEKKVIEIELKKKVPVNGIFIREKVISNIIIVRETASADTAAAEKYPEDNS